MRHKERLNDLTQDRERANTSQALNLASPSPVSYPQKSSIVVFHKNDQDKEMALCLMALD